MVYMTLYSEDGSMAGFLRWQLAAFNTSDWNTGNQGRAEDFRLP